MTGALSLEATIVEWGKGRYAAFSVTVTS